MRLFPIRPNAFDGAFVGFLESLGGVAGNTRVCVHVSLGGVAGNTLVDTLEPLGDVPCNTLVDILEALGDVACNMLVYIHVYVVLPWVLSTHISTSPFPLLTAGNHPD